MNNKYDQISGKIAEHIRLTLEYVSGISQDSFENNRMIQDACIFNVLQVGELAARAIEYGIDQEHPEIMWRQMRGLRNRIVHGYEKVRKAIIWTTITQDLPVIRESLLKLLQ